MFSAISSYLFGDDATETRQNAETSCKTEDAAVDDWIFVQVSCGGKSQKTLFIIIIYYT